MKIANILGAKVNEIYFTSGGSESDNMIIKGIALANKNKGNHIITSKIEHPAVLNTCKFLERIGFKVTYINTDSKGIIDLNELEKSITKNTILISIMFANNEIGTIEPIEEIAEIAKESSEGEASQVEFDENNHLNDIVEERLQAIYNLMNYAQLNPQFLDDWAESLWRSGICTKEEAEREKAIFKLQDVKNEILRRKFAGSSSLYKMILNSIDRQGTLAKTTMLSEEDGVTNWSNGRPVRDLNFRRGSIDVSSYVELVEPEDGIWSSIPYNQKAKWKCSYKGEDVFFESSVDVNDLEEETEETSSVAIKGVTVTADGVIAYKNATLDLTTGSFKGEGVKTISFTAKKRNAEVTAKFVVCCDVKTATSYNYTIDVELTNGNVYTATGKLVESTIPDAIDWTKDMACVKFAANTAFAKK